MMTKMTMIKTTQLVKAFLLANGVLVIVSYFFFGLSSLWSTEMGFLSSLLILLASRKSYASMVSSRVEAGIVSLDADRDIIDKLEDPYDLYSEEIEPETEKDLVEVVKEAKEANKASRRSVKETVKDSKAAFSPYRLGAYAFLVFGFLYLNRHQMLQIMPYMIALALPIMVMVWVLLDTHKHLES